MPFSKSALETYVKTLFFFSVDFFLFCFVFLCVCVHHMMAKLCRSPFLRLYLSEIETQFKGKFSMTRFCICFFFSLECVSTYLILVKQYFHLQIRNLHSFCYADAAIVLKIRRNTGTVSILNQ